MAGNLRQPYLDAGSALRAAITSAGVTQEDLALHLGFADGSAVSKWVQGRSAVPARHLSAICAFLQADDLADSLRTDPPDSDADRYDVFLASPMAALVEEDYDHSRTEAVRLVDAIEAHGAAVYWAGREIGRDGRFEAPDLATLKNLTALRSSASFVYLQNAELRKSTSAFIELGLALAWKMPVTIFVREQAWLPYMLQNFEGVAAQFGDFERVRVYGYETLDSVVGHVGMHGLNLMGLPPGARRSRVSERNERSNPM
jgi:transcriptional regulator with XRE-family HTH domain